MGSFLQRCGCFVSAFLLLLCCGCVNPSRQNKETEQASSLSDSGTEYITLNFPLITSGEPLDSLEEVEKRLNDYIEDKIEARIHLVTVDFSTLEDFYLLQSSSRQTVDFICLLPAESALPMMVDSGLMIPLDELLEEYGSGAANAAADILEIGKLNDIQYMIPQVKDNYTMGASLEFRGELVKKYHFDISSIRTIEDLEPFLEVISEQEPDVIPLTAVRSSGYTMPLSGCDNLIDTLGVLNLQKDNSLTVVNWYETEEFMELAKLMHKWYLKGYIAKDALIAQESGTALEKSGKAFSMISTIMPTGDEGMDLDSINGIVEVQLQNVPQLLTSYQAGLEGIGISSACKEPEKAMQFLNLLYTDEYVVNLLEYGIEGIDYTLSENNMVDTGESYFLLYGQPLNQTLCYVEVKDGSNYQAKCSAFAENDIISPAFGFVFDPSCVNREMSLCKAVVDKYYPLIDCGCVEPETEIPKFIQELKEAGIEQIIAEKQRQLDKWVSQSHNQ